MEQYIPAFPVHPEVRDDEPHAGMSLRDYFAGQALAGYFAAPYSGHRNCGRDEAKYIWSMADAMLATRNADPRP
jgi:hypothetical protein